MLGLLIEVGGVFQNLLFNSYGLSCSLPLSSFVMGDLEGIFL
jgi:hypothetical protein